MRAGNARLNPRPRKHGLELSQGVKALARAAAERRKASAPRKQMSCADCVHLSAARAAPEAPAHGDMSWRCAALVGCASRRSAPSLIAGGESISARGRGQNSGTICRESVSSFRHWRI